MAQYRVGRVTLTNDSDVVIGTDTAWLANAATGDIFLPNGDEIPYRVATVISDTELRLNGRYAGATRSNVNYSLTRDFTPNLGLPVIRVGDVDAVPVFAEALIMLDARTLPGGNPGTGYSLNDIIDVSTAGAEVGDQLVMLGDGSFGFVEPTAVSFNVVNVALEVSSGGGVLKSYADGVATLRRIKANGGSVTENENDLTINIPAPGEINTLAHIGTLDSVSLVAPKSGSQLRAYGLRPGTGMAIVREGNDIVFTSTATGGGGGATYTLVSVGTGQSLVATPNGSQFQIRSLAFDANRFDVIEAENTISIALKAFAITDISTVQWSQINDGQVLARSGNNIVGAALPEPGIQSLADDTAPQLGGDLDTAGKRIKGFPLGFHGLIERPRSKSYIVCFSAQHPMTITSIVTGTSVGTINFRVDIGVPPEDSQEGPTDSPLQGAASNGRNSTSATTPIAVQTGQQVTLTLFGPSADVEDFVYSIIGESA